MKKHAFADQQDAWMAQPGEMSVFAGFLIILSCPSSATLLTSGSAGTTQNNPKAFQCFSRAKQAQIFRKYLDWQVLHAWVSYLVYELIAICSCIFISWRWLLAPEDVNNKEDHAPGAPAESNADNMKDGALEDKPEDKPEDKSEDKLQDKSEDKPEGRQ